jgi:hypothetical protein
MKVRIASLFITLVSCITFTHSEIVLNDTSAYLCIFVVDYSDSTFEGGYVQELKPCAGCDSLPLQMEFHEPMDFGSVAFRYAVNSEIVFAGGIVWMGRGKIETPDTIFPPGLFSTAETSAPLPSIVKHYYHSSLTLTPNIDYAWPMIHKLKIVNDLMEQESFVGMYLYPPSVGMFDPDAAKIIVFIYRNSVADAPITHRKAYDKKVASLFKICWNRYGHSIGILSRNSAVFNLQGRMVHQAINPKRN